MAALLPASLPAPDRCLLEPHNDICLDTCDEVAVLPEHWREGDVCEGEPGTLTVAGSPLERHAS